VYWIQLAQDKGQFLAFVKAARERFEVLMAFIANITVFCDIALFGIWLPDLRRNLLSSSLFCREDVAEICSKT
jgi:hypothetical protein